MSELDDRLIEGRATVATMDPPEDLWTRALERSNDGAIALPELTTVRHRRRPALWLAVAAVTVLLALFGAWALLDDQQAVDTTPATEVPVAPEPTNDGGPTTLATAQDAVIGGLGVLSGRTLNIDAVEQDGEVTGEVRVDNIVVTLECATTTFSGKDLVLGGRVSDDPDGQGLIYFAQGGTRLEDGSWDTSGEETVAEGDAVALVIREGQRVSFSRGEPFSDREPPASCNEFVESVPALDGGFFSGVGGDIETNLLSTIRPCDEWTEREVTDDDVHDTGCTVGSVLAWSYTYDCTDGRVLYWNAPGWGFVGERANAYEHGAERLPPAAQRQAWGIPPEALMVPAKALP